MISVTPVPAPSLPSNTIIGRRESNSTSTHVSASSASASTSSGSGSGSGPGRKGKSKAKENWDDDFVFHRPPPKPQPLPAARGSSPVPSFADSAIWGDSSDEETDAGADDTIKLALPLSSSLCTTADDTVGFRAPREEVETRLEAPARRLAMKQRDAGETIRLQDNAGSTSSRLVPASTAALRLASSLEAGPSSSKGPESPTTESRPKGVGRLLSRVSKRFSGSPVLDDVSSLPLRRPKSSTNVQDLQSRRSVSRSSSIKRSSSSILRAIHPSASTSSLVSSSPPLPLYPSPPFTAHPSRGFHLPSPSPNSPYHSATSLHGSGIFPARSASGSSAQSEPIPPLPTSSSFPILTNRSQVDDPKDPERTPRKKPRPASVQVSKKPSLRDAGLGLGLASESGWRANWKGPTPTQSDASRKKFEMSITFDMPTTPTSGKPQTALRRLGSLSKKHGRKLSGGWRFGSGLTAADPPLPTVVASPAPRAEAASAPTSSFLPRAASMRQVDAREVSAAVESWATPDDDVPVKSDKRRNSWNDLLIPRDVLAKQKELKAGMSAVRRFAKGVEALKKMKQEYAALGSAARDDSFAQWWEIADVLIEVGSTAAPEDESTAQRPSRERRVTLASGANDSPRPATPRASSDSVYHDAYSEDESGPPRAKQPDQWRASTGRQDLSRRQLEVLRSMLTSPSTASIASLTAPPPPAGAAPVLGVADRPVSTATTDTPKPRRGSRAGLQSLKDFVRSLRTTPRSGSVKISSNPKAERRPPVSYPASGPSASDSRSSFSALRAPGTYGIPSTSRPSVRGMFRSTPSASEVPAAIVSLPDLGHHGPRASESPRAQQQQRDLEATVRPSNRRVLTDRGGVIEEIRVDPGRSTSAQSAPVDSRVDFGVIALTPENLGPLLEAVKACESKLRECLGRAGTQS